MLSTQFGEKWPWYLDFYTSTTHIAAFLSTGLESSADTLPLGGSDTHCEKYIYLDIQVYNFQASI